MHQLLSARLRKRGCLANARAQVGGGGVSGAWQPPLAAEEPDPAKVQVWTLPSSEQPVWPRCELREGACQLDRAPPHTPAGWVLTLAGVSHHQGACPAPSKLSLTPSLFPRGGGFGDPAPG